MSPKDNGKTLTTSRVTKNCEPGERNRPARAVRLRTSGVFLKHGVDGTIFVTPEEPLREYPATLTDRVDHWARVRPDQSCICKRAANGEWNSLTYSEVMDRVRKIGQAFLDRGFSAERPVVILSENDLEHFLLMLAGQHVGIPTASLSPAYSLVSRDFRRLRHALKLLTPGLVFAHDGIRYDHAIRAAVSDDVEIVVTSRPPTGRKATEFSTLLESGVTAAVTNAHSAIHPDAPAKFLFTSGSTAMPKAVINSHRMICSNAQMMAQVFPFLQDEPPVIVDWLPWNHTFGGNHNLGAAIYNGGTFYIDEGKPGTAAMKETVRNLREISPTIYFNVPKGYEELLVALRVDATLRENFFRRLNILFYAAAGLSQKIWDAYREIAIRPSGERIIMVTGLGATETSPMAIQSSWETDQAGSIGIPVPGVELKLVPEGRKLGARVRGPNITPGYWRQPELTKLAFDSDGFYRFGDAVRIADPANINKGFIFDGRIAEDFKLDTGTWVSVGPLRAIAVSFFSPFVKDVVITGHDRSFVGMLVFPDIEACRTLCSQSGEEVSVEQILRHDVVRRQFENLLDEFSNDSTGASSRIERLLLLEEPPSLDHGEITDKGSLNQRAILERRENLVEEIYSEIPSGRVLQMKRQ